MGGNAVFTREVLQRVGPYSTSLGRSGTRLLSCEDEDMYQRLRAAGARGLYLPQLIVYHFIPRERLTKSYHRSWCFWKREPASRFSNELSLWDLAGFFYGKHFYRPDS